MSMHDRDHKHIEVPRTIESIYRNIETFHGEDLAVTFTAQELNTFAALLPDDSPLIDKIQKYLLEAPRMFYLNCYNKRACFGGPEEGGWWQSIIEPLYSTGYTSFENALIDFIDEARAQFIDLDEARNEMPKPDKYGNRPAAPLFTLFDPLSVKKVCELYVRFQQIPSDTIFPGLRAEFDKFVANELQPSIDLDWLATAEIGPNGLATTPLYLQYFDDHTDEIITNHFQLSYKAGDPDETTILEISTVPYESAKTHRYQYC